MRDPALIRAVTRKTAPVMSTTLGGPVRPIRGEPALDQSGRPDGALVSDRGPASLTAHSNPRRSPTGLSRRRDSASS